MHKIRLPLGFRHRTRWGSLQRSLRSPNCINGSTSKGREGQKGEEEDGLEGKKEKEEGKEGKK